MKVLVSACMLGLNTRYDAKNKKDERLIEYLKRKNIEFFPLCAEQLGGLSTPRQPSEIEKGYTSKDVLEGRAKVISKYINPKQTIICCLHAAKEGIENIQKEYPDIHIYSLFGPSDVNEKYYIVNGPGDCGDRCFNTH